MMAYERLQTWKTAHEFAVAVYRTTQSFPKSELYGLTSQIRRAAFAVPANIAEGSLKWGRSAGVRDDMRCPSTTTGRSTQITPAFSMSSLIARTLVARLPFRILAEIGTQPAWQMNATGFPA